MTGASAEYEFSSEIVFRVATEAAEELRLVIKESRPGDLYFLADDSVAYTPHGEFVGVYLEPRGPKSTRVTVSTKVPLFPLLKVNRVDYKKELHLRLREKLDLY